MERFLKEQQVKAQAVEAIRNAEEVLVVTIDENGDSHLHRSPVTHALIGATQMWVMDMIMDKQSYLEEEL